MEFFNKLRIKYKNFTKHFILRNQFCKCCGKDMDYDYWIDNNLWKKLPKQYQNKVLCLECFCKLYPYADNFSVEMYTLGKYKK